MEVKVRDNQVDKALRVLKRKLQAEGIFREMRQREFYESPSEKRRREKNEATRRYQRERRRQAEADRRR
ncbi:30S ribosomal protein S21 [Mesorhizobium sp. SP-1A]|uniref:30S ribosomal protein S21 n=1 Tax=Mesorhizobium sp. SP-1A TaxID=3077840 RepID=UPI0028F73107|nr:30S ribosomal protein S21 [Mesorhizobium sp. SP-1A]